MSPRVYPYGIAICWYRWLAYHLAWSLCYMRMCLPLTLSTNLIIRDDWSGLPSPFHLNLPLTSSDVIFFIKPFRPFLKDFASFSKEQRETSFYDNFSIWSSFSPIQVALYSEWRDLWNETISKCSLRLSFSFDLQRICAIWHLLPLMWSLLDLEVYPRSIFGSSQHGLSINPLRNCLHLKEDYT